MTSPTYRCYRLDGVGRLHDAEWVKADSDEDALDQVPALHPEGRFEIWHGTRLVASASPLRHFA